MMLNTAMIKHESEAYYAIYDGVTIDENLKALFDAREDNPMIVVHGDTIEQLAEKLIIDSEVLQATYDRYQSFCES